MGSDTPLGTAYESLNPVKSLAPRRAVIQYIIIEIQNSYLDYKPILTFVLGFVGFPTGVLTVSVLPESISV